MPSPTEITVAQLSRLIGLPGAPAIIDVRDEDDYAADPAADSRSRAPRLPRRRRLGAGTMPAARRSSSARRG